MERPTLCTTVQRMTRPNFQLFRNTKNAITENRKSVISKSIFYKFNLKVKPCLLIRKIQFHFYILNVNKIR